MKLFRTIDIEKDQRINIFCKSGSLVLYLVFILIGYFYTGYLFFPMNDAFFLHIGLLLVCFALFICLHEICHFLVARLNGIHAKLILDFIFPFASLENQRIPFKKYVFIILAPFFFLTPVLIVLLFLVPAQWIWIPWILLAHGLAGGLSDFVAFMYIRYYPKAEIEDNNRQILLYLSEEDCKQAKLADQKRLDAHHRKKQTGVLVKTKAEMQKEKAKQKTDYKKEEADVEAEDIDDLQKLDF